MVRSDTNVSHGLDPPDSNCTLNPSCDRTRRLELAEELNQALSEDLDISQLLNLQHSQERAHPPLFHTLNRRTLPTASVSQAETLAIPASELAILFQSIDDVLASFSHHHDRHALSLNRLRSVQAQARIFSSDAVRTGRDGTTQTEQDPRPQYHPTKHPIVFCHGLMGFDTLSIGPSVATLRIPHWKGIHEALEAIGVEMLMARVPATSAPAERARVLGQAISERFPGRKVHLIGHSMGGLDCRYLTTHLAQDLPFDVLSVTTISTPHRGTSFADYVVNALGASRLPLVLSLINVLPDRLGGGSGAGFEALTTDKMRKFNEDTPDVPGVRYFSWGAWYDPGLMDISRSSQRIVLEREGPNDGLISVESAKWGTYLGTLENVAHHDLIGWTDVTRYAWAKVRGRTINFKPTYFYMAMVTYLARMVEGEEMLDESEEEASRVLDRQTDNTVNVEGVEDAT